MPIRNESTAFSKMAHVSVPEHWRTSSGRTPVAIIFIARFRDKARGRAEAQRLAQEWKPTK
jgi:hypothetical protein